MKQPLWDLRQYRLKQTLRLPGGNVSDVAFTPNGRMLAAAGAYNANAFHAAGYIRLYRLQ